MCDVQAHGGVGEVSGCQEREEKWGQAKECHTRSRCGTQVLRKNSRGCKERREIAFGGEDESGR